MAPPLRHGFMKQSDTLGGLILSPLTRSVLFCHLQCERRGAERKVCLFAFVSFFLPSFVPACRACHFSGALCCCCCCCCIFFLWCSLFHLTSDLARFGAQFRSCITAQPPPQPKTYSHHIFPQTDTLPSHSKQINSSLATV